MGVNGSPMSQTSFLTNHAHVMLCIAHDPDSRLRDISATVGITERAAHRIVAELVEDGYVTRERRGRRNRYHVHPERPFAHPNSSHPLLRDRTMEELLSVFLVDSEPVRQAA
jgi:predicted ArsR family transcriptional regulator